MSFVSGVFVVYQGRLSAAEHGKFASDMQQAAQLRLLSDLKAIKSEVCTCLRLASEFAWIADDAALESISPSFLAVFCLSVLLQPPEGCSASPVSEDNLYLWAATIFGPEVRVLSGCEAAQPCRSTNP